MKASESRGESWDNDEGDVAHADDISHAYDFLKKAIYVLKGLYQEKR